MKIYGLIYCFINLLDGKMYIGKKTGEKGMKCFHSGKYIGSSPSHTPYMRSRLKHGNDNFYPIILEYIYGDKHDLNTAERKWIASIREQRGKDMVYNLTDGGDGRSNFNWSDIEKKKISDGMHERVKNDPEYGEKRRIGMKNAWEDPIWKNEMIRKIQIGSAKQESKIAKSIKGKRSFEGPYRFISPNGILYEFISLSEFCREHVLNVTCMSRVYGGHKPHFQGWKKFISLQIQPNT